MTNNRIITTLFTWLCLSLLCTSIRFGSDSEYSSSHSIDTVDNQLVADIHSHPLWIQKELNDDDSDEDNSNELMFILKRASHQRFHAMRGK
ncbi:unnamed protein product, partial [Didymodactylos carnosus]